MASLFRWLGVFLFLAGSAYADPLPVEAFSSLPAFEQPRLSPDGAYIAYLEPRNGRFVLAVRKLSPGADEKPAMLGNDDWIITRVRWVSNDRLAVLMRRGERVSKLGPRVITIGRTLSVSPDFKESTVLMHDQQDLAVNSLAGITELIEDDPEHAIAPLYVRDASRAFRLDLLKVNVRTGESETAYTGLPSTKWWLTDGSGKAVARLDMTTKPLRDHLMRYENGSWQNLASFDVSGDAESGIQGLSADGKSLVQLSNNDSGFKSVFQIGLNEGKTGKLLYSNPSYDVFSTIKDEWTGRVIGARFANDKVNSVYFDPVHSAIQKELDQRFPGCTARIQSESRDGSKLIIGVHGPRQPSSYYLMDAATRKLEFIASAYPALKAEDLGDMKPYPYKARDGLKIESYLTLPPGQEAKNLPLIIIPHGGPDSRIVLGFDWWTQFLVNRGYAVLHPNFRGSGGYGRSFTEAGLMQWGRKIQNDVTDGVRKLVSDGIADPKRVCIFGASFGGYVALAGATLTPDVFACAVSIAGMSELTEMLKSEEMDSGKDSEYVSFWNSRIGNVEENKVLLQQISPALHAADVKASILLMHGEDDTTVRINQSEIMYDALKAAGKNVKFVRFKNDDHFLSLADTRIRMAKELDRFLTANIGAPAPSANSER